MGPIASTVVSACMAVIMVTATVGFVVTVASLMYGAFKQEFRRGR